jgi:MFS transporter, DHA2 family, multidrug resistance protein
MSVTEVEPAAGLSSSRRAMITAGVMLATVLQSLDTTITTVAMPHMQGAFSANLEQVTWILTSYLVAAAIMTPPTGWLAARFGRKRLYLLSVGGFTIASALCGMAESLTVIVVFRLFQGLFGAALIPLSQATLLDTHPRERHGQAMAIWGMGVTGGSILGPTLGGWLIQNYSWRWVFYINVPVGLVAALMITAFVEETGRNRRLQFDAIGFAALSLAIAAFQIMLDRGQIEDWFSSREIIVEAVIAGLAFYAFLMRTLTAERPFIRPSLFTDHNFTLALLVRFSNSMILFGSLALFPPFLQELLNYPVLTAGLVLAPRGLGALMAMAVVGQLLRRFEPRWLIPVGFLISAYALFLMTHFSLDVPTWEIIATGIVQGVGLGFVNVPVTTVAFSTLAPERRTEAASIYNVLRAIGSSAGIAILTALLERNTQINHAMIGAVATPFNPLFRGGIVGQHWNLGTAAGLAFLNAEVTRQATMIAYLDDFTLMMIAALILAPLALFFGRIHTRPAAPGGSIAPEVE